MARILVATADGLHDFSESGRPGEVLHPGRDVAAIAPAGSEELWAILEGREIWHTAGIDGWFHVGDVPEGLRAQCIADTRAGVIVGTSEAHLYRIAGVPLGKEMAGVPLGKEMAGVPLGKEMAGVPLGKEVAGVPLGKEMAGVPLGKEMAGEGLDPVVPFDESEGRERWFTPWGGPPDTRTITEDREAVYVNVHVGGILRSVDAGETWTPTLAIENDVHKVLARPGRLYAACARGLAVSPDCGGTWAIKVQGLHATYCRGVAVCRDWVLLSASEGPRGRRSALYRGSLDPASLERCGNGLPEFFDANIDSLCLDAVPSGELAAFGLPDGSVYASLDQGESWDLVASGLPRVNCVLTLP